MEVSNLSFVIYSLTYRLNFYIVYSTTKRALKIIGPRTEVYINIRKPHTENEITDSTSDIHWNEYEVDKDEKQKKNKKLVFSLLANSFLRIFYNNPVLLLLLTMHFYKFIIYFF